MGKSQRRKGCDNERSIVRELRKKGIICDRVPLSGAMGGKYAGDIIIEDRLRFEAKVRAEGFKELYKWIEGNDGLIVRADRKEWLVVHRLSDVVKVLPLLSEQKNGKVTA